MVPSNDDELTIASADDVVKARQLVRVRAIEAGLGLVDQTKIITAASELARREAAFHSHRSRSAEKVR